MSDVHQRIDEIVKNHRVVLFMKGTAQFPMCGFSGRAIQILKACGVADLTTVNVLEDDEMRLAASAAQALEEADGVQRAGRAGDADDDAGAVVGHVPAPTLRRRRRALAEARRPGTSRS